MKKYIAMCLACFMMLSCLSGCASKSQNNADSSASASSNATVKTEKGKLQIVTTIFPAYDWVKSILGDKADNAEITLLLDNGVDLHSYQANAEDILKISNCDLFIYVGGESDQWVEDALHEAINPDMEAINLLEVLGNSAKEEEIVEGMEAEHEESDEEDEQEHKESGGKEKHEHEKSGEETEHEYDEHVWLSLKNAKTLCNTIAKTMGKIAPNNAKKYQENVKAYTAKLAALDMEYKKVTDSSAQKTLLFGDRFPFRYLIDDYGLSYYAAFAGCSSETEASFATITFLAGKVDELALQTILTIEKSDQKIAKTIRDNTKTKDQKILSLDSMQSTTSQDISEGATYLSAMENNLNVLREALK